MSGTATQVTLTSPPSTTPASLDDTRKTLAWGLTIGIFSVFSLIFIAVLAGSVTVADAKELVTGMFLPLFGVIGPIIAFFFARPH